MTGRGSLPGSLPVGYRFIPSDEELVAFYLVKKVFDKSLPQLVATIITDISQREFYSKPPKQLGTDILAWEGKAVVATKIMRTYLSGHGLKAKKTHWEMEEYQLCQIESAYDKLESDQSGKVGHIEYELQNNQNQGHVENKLENNHDRNARSIDNTLENEHNRDNSNVDDEVEDNHNRDESTSGCESENHDLHNRDERTEVDEMDIWKSERENENVKLDNVEDEMRKGLVQIDKWTLWVTKIGLVGGNYILSGEFLLGCSGSDGDGDA
ncbi:hypothetical protein F8388_010834 [Cannabis sativa]|uniref:NAC domain-containing protein n=1 Tax=Cannabis sativa TaxID=3483 RepID=A0A7J6HD52_CANSA|nr:hypothetical protein F8388_010834 [Cannabis sativa]